VSARRVLAALLAAVGFAAGTAAAHAQSLPSAPPGVQYVAALRDALQALPSADVAPDDPRLDRVRAPLRLAESIAGDSVALDPITAALDHDPADVATARTDLQTLIAAVQLPPNSVAEDPHASRSVLDDVYRQSRFSGLGRRGGGDDLFSRIGRGLLDFLRWLASHLVGTLGLVPTVLLAALLLGLLLGFVVLRVQRAGVPGFGRIAPEPAGPGLDPDAEWRLALAAAERGAHRDAVRHAFRSALLAIAERGRLHVDAAWTTAELLARARGDADLVAALAPAADAFDRAWYSGRPVARDDWEVARDRCQAVRQLAGRRAAGVTG
jgi:hypothetical protein